MKLKRKVTRPICSLILVMSVPVGGLSEQGPTDPMIDVLVTDSVEVHSTEEVMAYLLGHDFEWPVVGDSPALIVPRITQ